MDLDQLEAFVSVATLGGFTRASGKLHRTQPAISRRVQLLERSLGVELFARRGREVTLTPEGRALLPYAQGALAALRDGLCAISEAGGTCAGPPLEVALVGTLADVQLASVLRRFRDIRPDTLNLRTAASREVSALVLRGEADIGIRYFPDHHPDLETIAVGVERLTLVVAADHRLAECVAVDALDLVDEHWLSFPFGADDPGSFGHLLERALLAVGISEPNLTIIDSLTAQKRLAQAGYGIAFLPPGGCQDELEGGSLRQLRVRGLEPAQPIVAVRRRSAFRRAAVDEFLRIVQEALGPALAALAERHAGPARPPTNKS